MKRKCDWCSNYYEFERSTSRYCCDTCRQNAYRARKYGISLPKVEVDTGRRPGKVSEDQIAAAVAGLRGAVSVLDSGARAAEGEGRRELCAYLSACVVTALREVGL